jgi:hypothetical protein
MCWAKGKGGEMANPADVGLHQDARGVWRRPAPISEVVISPEGDMSDLDWWLS